MQHSHLPEYQSHKKVRAFKIAGIQRAEENRAAMLIPENSSLYPQGGCPVDETYLARHRPQIGGYFVVYDDGYTSYSPAKAFESGYKPAE